MKFIKKLNAAKLLGLHFLIYQGVDMIKEREANEHPSKGYIVANSC